jgi:protein DEK
LKKLLLVKFALNNETKISKKQKKPRKAVTTPSKSSPQKKNSKGRPKRAAPPAKKKRKDETSDEEDAEEDVGESEDDEPLKKPPKKGAKEGSDGMPTDDDIKKLLKDILAEANLEEITMKTVCKKVYAHYPNHDLSQRKDFIKQTVKSVSLLLPFSFDRLTNFNFFIYSSSPHNFLSYFFSYS